MDTPQHYLCDSSISQDPFEAILRLRGQSAALEFIGGTAIKYLVRYDRKGAAIEDLKKSITCIERMIQILEQNP